MINEDIIKQIEKDTSETEGYFDFCIDAEYMDQEHIQANRDGIKLFASMLLRIAYDINPPRNENNPDLFNINNNLFFDTQDRPVYYIHMIDKGKSQLSKLDFEPKESWKDNWVGWTIVSLFIFMIICSFIGAYKVFQWVFF